MLSVSEVATALQTVLTTTADDLARSTGWVKRRRKFSGATLCQTLVLGWLAHPQATLEQLMQMAAACGVTATPQALDQRWGEPAATCLKDVLAAAIGQIMAHDPVAIPLLARFSGVFVQDSSTITLPAALAEIWPGCGDATPTGHTAVVKLGVRLDLCCGTLHGPTLAAGRTHDRTVLTDLPPLPPDSLRLADLGFFSLAELADLDDHDILWITRMQAGTVVFVDGERVTLSAFLKRQGEAPLDCQVEVGVRQRLPCRLIAVRVPHHVVRARRARMRDEARRRQQPVNPERLALAAWTILITNVPADRLTYQEVLVLARARWQIELLFKLWKQHGGIEAWRTDKSWRILCELYAKLIAMVVQHWVLLLGCWAVPQRSVVKAAATVRQQATVIAWGLRFPHWLETHLSLIVECLAAGCRMNRRKAKPNTYQLLLDPALLT